MTKFVSRPSRRDGETPPGQKVRLITNLIKIVLSQNGVIYQSGVNVDLIEDKKPEAVDSKEKTSKKLSHNIRREAVKKAISDYIKNNPAGSPRKYCYVMDANASTILATFKIGSDDKKSIEITTKLQLPTNSGDVIEKEFKVAIFRPEEIKLSDNSTSPMHMRALNVILTSNYCEIPRYLVTKATASHTSIFPFKQENQFPISEGIVCNKGYSVSARPAEIGLVLNVANTSAPFYDDCKLVDFIKMRYRRVNLSTKMDLAVVAQLKKELMNKQVEALHLNYGTNERPHHPKYRIRDISSSSNEMITIADKVKKTTEELSIREYFLKKYKKKLEYPNLPCVIDNGRKIPLELCRLVARQKVVRKLTPEETSKTIERTAMPAIQHFREVERNVKELYDNNTKCAGENFGIKLNPQLIEVDGRELPPISMKAGFNKIVPTGDGQYNVMREKFFKPAVIKKWAVAFLRGQRSPPKQDLDGDTRRMFSPWYIQNAAQRGVKVGPVENVFFPEQDIESTGEKEVRMMLKSFFNYCNSQKFDHVIFILPQNCPDFVYGYLQYLEATEKGSRGADETWTRSSCLKLDNFQRKIIRDSRQGSMFISNLWLKYNTKLGGSNFILHPTELNAKHLQPGYLYVSIDVCHPAPGDKLIQSVAAVVGMWNLTGPQGISYCTRMRVQKKENENKSTIEHVLEVDKMFIEVLRSFKKSKGRVPTHIVLLRDGVSEGQFEIVLNRELSSINQLLTNIYNKEKQPKAKLSCFVVQKRHKIRFRRRDPIATKRGDDYNIRPGTVVDKDVTHPTDHSFYIAPHKAIQGTARAAYIYMIYDEINFSQDEAQALIFSLSYLSPRCTKGTSIPTPVNLADRAAERGRNLVIAWNTDNYQKLKDEQRIIKLNEMLENIGDANYRHTLFYI